MYLFSDDDNVSTRMTFLRHFGAGFLVWFVFSPVLSLISFSISLLWRLKVVLSRLLNLLHLLLSAYFACWYICLYLKCEEVPFFWYVFCDFAIGLSFLVNFIAFSICIHLFWPRGSSRQDFLVSSSYPEEFDEYEQSIVLSDNEVYVKNNNQL